MAPFVERPPFIGRYEHSLDDKGRVILPAKWRGHFAHGGYMTTYRDGCLALWTPEEYQKQLSAMEELQKRGRTQRNRARVWSSRSQEFELDGRSGRMPIPAKLREFAQLDGEVLIVGAIDRVELWNPAVWEDKVQPSEQAWIDGEDEEV